MPSKGLGGGEGWYPGETAGMVRDPVTQPRFGWSQGGQPCLLLPCFSKLIKGNVTSPGAGAGLQPLTVTLPYAGLY